MTEQGTELGASSDGDFEQSHPRHKQRIRVDHGIVAATGNPSFVTGSASPATGSDSLGNFRMQSLENGGS